MTRPDIREILATVRSIAVVGYSRRPGRPSHWVSNYLEEQGFAVQRVNPTLAGEPGPMVYASLADVPGPIDVVDVFRAPEHGPEIAAAAIAAGAKVLWMQPGAENWDAARTARDAGMVTVVGPCLYAEHRAWKAMTASG